MKKHSLCWLMLLFSLFIFNQIAYSSAVDLSNIDEPATNMGKINQSLEKAEGRNKAELLLKRGEIYRSLGYYPDAQADFAAALETSQKLKPILPYLEIVSTQSLGYIHYLMQDAQKAETLLNLALEKADKLTATFDNNSPSPALLGSFVLAASCANHLGNVYIAQNRNEEALKIYKTALNYLEKTVDSTAKESQFVKTSDPALKATIHRNIASVIGDKSSAFAHLDTATKLVSQIASPHEKVRLLLDISSEYGSIEPSTEGDALRYPLLDQALSIALSLKDHRLISLASGEFGKLYESRDRIADATALTEQAVTSALAIQSHDLLLQWEWQWGRLLQKQEQQKQAIEAFQRALFHVSAIRQDMPIRSNFKGGCSTFRETLFPLYIGLADMLLKESGVAKDKQEEQKLLRDAQQALESIKQSELRDYFQDTCIDAMTHEIQSLSSSTAVIYPVILPDRLEVLSDIGGTLYRRIIHVKKDELNQAVTQLASNLRNGLFYEELGKLVYGWVIKPLQSILYAQNVKTLVVVPDGAFRMLPLAALWNGQEFLGQKYAVVVEPALTLLDPSPLPVGQRKTLLAGVSRPGPVVLELPTLLWNQLSNTVPSSVNRGVRELSIKTVEPTTRTNDTSNSTAIERSSNVKSNENVEKVKEILALPGVDKEINDLSKNLNAQTLMNKSFLRERFSDEIREQNYRIVHIASHGFFGGSPEENFIMAYDKLLNMNLLEEYIKPKKFADLPVELLTLSACQTAEGDDRSPLGLSGVALKSGARSVLGSLWPVSDNATQILLSSFYRNLNSSSDISKAEALQKAQIELINTKEFNHPFFWAPFILVGNWL